jgi:hypothetical protein
VTCSKSEAVDRMATTQGEGAEVRATRLDELLATQHFESLSVIQWIGVLDPASLAPCSTSSSHSQIYPRATVVFMAARRPTTGPEVSGPNLFGNMPCGSTPG